eukprot:scaffold1124_cov131-Isochrysis_galbana.AAC.9
MVVGKFCERFARLRADQSCLEAKARRGGFEKGPRQRMRTLTLTMDARVGISNLRRGALLIIAVATDCEGHTRTCADAELHRALLPNCSSM